MGEGHAEDEADCLEAVARLQPVDLGRLHEAAEEARARAKPEDKPGAGRKAKRCGSCTGKVVTKEMLSIVPQLEEIAGAHAGLAVPPAV